MSKSWSAKKILVSAILILLPALYTGCGGSTKTSMSSGGSNGSGSGGSGANGGGTGNGHLACDVMSTGQGASLNGFVPFTSKSPWNTDISSAPVDPNSNS